MVIVITMARGNRIAGPGRGHVEWAGADFDPEHPGHLREWGLGRRFITPLGQKSFSI